MRTIPALSALASGVLVTLSLAPFSLWPAALLAAALLFFALSKATAKQGFVLGWVFGLGLFGSGASWVYVSIHEFGYAGNALALSLTILFCAGLALCSALTCWLYVALRNSNHQKISAMWLFATTMVAGEWLRSWLLTGFPWLYLGYSQTSGVLAGYAPLVGVYGISFILYASGALISQSLLLTRWSKQYVLANVTSIIVFWSFAPLLATQVWTTTASDPLKVSMVQANISQHDKWRSEFLQSSLDLYRQMTENEWQSSTLVIWPEAALPITRQRADFFISDVGEKARRQQSTLLTGIPYRDPNNGKVYNSAIAIGNGQGTYHKHRLVPFGEYIPFAALIGPVAEFFALPLSSMAAGEREQQPLLFDQWYTRPLICYEIVYPALAAQAAKTSDVLVTISNDAWFGRSIGPLQHLQMAQMRAVETGRYVLRSTGSGVSAIISPKGKIVGQTTQFERDILRGEFTAMQGQTPWVRSGHWLVPAALLGLLTAFGTKRLFFSRKPTS